MKVTLYSTNCPKCNILEKKLNEKGVAFDIVTDPDKITEKGFLSAPLLEVDGEIMDFSKGFVWVSSLEV